MSRRKTLFMLICSLSGGLLLAFWIRSPRIDILRLQEHLEKHRPTLGRLKGQSNHLPFPSFLQPESEQWSNFEQSGDYLMRTAPTGQSESLLGRIDLLRGHHKEAANHFRKARLLEASLEHENDLAVALLELGNSDPFFLIEALETLGPLASQAPDHPEIAFNLALTLDALSLTKIAAPAWQEFLTWHMGDAWEPEARQRLDAHQTLPTPIDWTPLDPTQTLEIGEGLEWDTALADGLLNGRSFFLEKCLWSWSFFTLQGDQTRSERAFHLSQAVASAVDSIHSDPICKDILAQLKKDQAPAIQQFTTALLHFRSGAYEKSYQALTSMPRLANEPLQNWAGYYHALILYQNHKFTESLEQLQRLLDRNTHPYLTAECLKLQGLIHGHQNNIYLYLKYSTEALLAAEPLKNDLITGAIRKNQVEAFQILGLEDRAIEMYLAQFLATRGRGPATIQRLVAGQLGQLFMDRGQPYAASFFFDEMVAWARVEGKPASLAQALRFREKAFLQAGIPRESSQAVLDEARQLARKISSQETQANVLAEIELVRGISLATTNPRQAQEHLRKAFTYFEKERSITRLVEVDLWLARCQSQLGNLESSQANYLQGIERVESLRERVLEGQFRISFLDHSLLIFEELVALYLENEQPDLALATAERSRARFLLDHQRYPQAVASLSEELREKIPEDTLLVAYFTTPEDTHYWVFSRGNHSFGKLELASSELDQQLEGLALDLDQSQKPSALSTKVEMLSMVLFQPFSKDFQSKKNLVIVPHRTLWSFPFSASRLNDRFLLEDHTLTLAPSLLHYLGSLRQAESHGTRERNHLLAIGNPTFDPYLSHGKPRLPGAEIEAASLTNYPTRSVLLTQHATPSRMLEGIGQADVVHYAGHVEFVPHNPLGSMLLLAPEANHTGQLKAHEIYRQRFQRPQVLVLAGCESGRTGHSISEGGGDMARAFLAAGIPSVIATLREISDTQNQAFVQTLHGYLRKGLSPSEALRQTQLEHLNTGDPWQTGAMWWRYQTFGLP